MHSGAVRGCSLCKGDDAHLGLCVAGWLHDIIDGVTMSCQGNTAYVNTNAIVMVTTGFWQGSSSDCSYLPNAACLRLYHVNVIRAALCGFSILLFFFFSPSNIPFWCLRASSFSPRWHFSSLSSRFDMSVFLSGLCLALPVSAPAGSC